MFPDNDGDAVSESFESGLGRPLVVDELDLDGLHGGDDEDGLGDAGPEAAQQPRPGSQRPYAQSLFLCPPSLLKK